MSQVQQQSKPPPLQDAGHRAAPPDDESDHNAEYYHQLYREAPPESQDPSPQLLEGAPRAAEGPPRLPETRVAYHRRTGTNVYQLDDVWQNAPAQQMAEPRPMRPRPARRARPVVAENHYRTGQAIATLFAALGWLIAGAGLALCVGSLALPALSVGLGLPHLLGGAAGALLVGLLTVALSLAGRAHFDHVNAAREMVALQRAAARVAEQH